MQLYGHGVTKNFLSILESEVQRSFRTIVRLLFLVGFLALAALLVFHRAIAPGYALYVGAFLAAVVLGVAWGHFVNTYRYQRSIRDHWNRWMRFSISCVTVRECYRKVQGKTPTRGVFWASVAIALVILGNVIVLVLSLDEATPWWRLAPVFAADAALIGFVAGMRWRERLWYRDFLRSVNELLAEGAIGVWGVY